MNRTFLWHQILVVLTFGAAAWLARILTDEYIRPAWISLGIRAILYSVACFGFVWVFLHLVGFSSDELGSQIGLLRRALGV